MNIQAISHFKQNYKANLKNKQDSTPSILKTDVIKLSSSQISFNGKLKDFVEINNCRKEAKTHQKDAMSILGNSDRHKNAAVSESGFRTVIEAQAYRYSELAKVQYDNAQKALEEAFSQLNSGKPAGEFVFSDGTKGSYICFNQDGKTGLTVVKANFSSEEGYHEPSVATMFDGKLTITSRAQAGREEIFKYDYSGTLEKYIQKANSISSGENIELTYVDGEIQTFDKKEWGNQKISRYVFEDGEITKKYTGMYYDNESTLHALDVYFFNEDEINYSIGYRCDKDRNESATREYTFKKDENGYYQLQEYKFRASKEKDGTLSAKKSYYYLGDEIATIAINQKGKNAKEATVDEYYTYTGNKPFIFEKNGTLHNERLVGAQEMRFLEIFHNIRHAIRERIFLGPKKDRY